ncbi:hypothetical protein ACQZ6F_19220 [Rhizobium sp. A22-96]
MKKTKIFLHAFVSRGANKGQIIFPHVHQGGTYVVSKTRFEDDYIHVSDPSEILSWLEKGYGLRMSNPEEGVTAPSLIAPQSIFRPVRI